MGRRLRKNYCFILAGAIFHGGWIAIAIVTLQIDKKYRSPEALISIA